MKTVSTFTRKRINNDTLSEIISIYQECCSPFDQALIKALEELKRHRELEEQGAVLNLPCKIGDKAWYINEDGITEVEVNSFVFNGKFLAYVSLYIRGERFKTTLTPYKNLFFTKEEAKEKWRELEGK